jgi:hypothetical protein
MMVAHLGQFGPTRNYCINSPRVRSDSTASKGMGGIVQDARWHEVITTHGTEN